MNVSLTDTIILHQDQAEQLFIGAVMMDAGYARKVCGWLDPAVFRDERLGSFWKRVRDGKEPSEAAIELGMYLDMSRWMLQVVNTYDLPVLAQTISDDTLLAEIARMLPDMAQAIGKRDVDGLKGLAKLIVDANAASGVMVKTSDQIASEFNEVLDNIAGRSEKTGITTLDRATGGLELSTMTLIAARPSMGKTSLGLQMCKYKAEEEGKRALYVSLEMNRISLWARMACGELKIAWRDVRAGRVDAQKIQAIKAKSLELRDRLGANLLIDDRSRLSMDEIWRTVSAEQPDFLLIDHLGLIAPTDKDEVKSLGDISWAGKAIAKTFDIPVVFLYQLNRGTEYRSGDDRRPQLKDIRGSGKIEENADNVFFLYRPDYYEDATDKPPVVSAAEIIVSKFRDGIRNIQIKLEYHLDEQYFYPQFIPPTGRKP